jgi:hypothetical protein
VTASLWFDLERMCGVIKYGDGNIDLHDVKSLLRRSQDAISSIQPLLSPDAITIRAVDGSTASYEVTITAGMSQDQYTNFLEMMINKGDTSE